MQALKIIDNLLREPQRKHVYDLLMDSRLTVTASVSSKRAEDHWVYQRIGTKERWW